MSDDEVSDDEVLATENDENQEDMVPELKSAGSFDLEDSMDEFDEEEEEEEELTQRRGIMQRDKTMRMSQSECICICEWMNE